MTFFEYVGDAQHHYRGLRLEVSPNAVVDFGVELPPDRYWEPHAGPATVRPLTNSAQVGPPTGQRPSFRGLWAGATQYSAGDACVTPWGSLVLANTAHFSEPSFTVAEEALWASDGAYRP